MGRRTLAPLLDGLAAISTASQDPHEMTEWLLHEISQVTGWPVAHALLVDPHGAVTAWFSGRNKDPAWEAYLVAADGLAMRTPTGLLDRVMATRRPGWVTDIDTEADYPRAIAARAAGLRGVFALPVVRGGHVVALLQFLSPERIEPDNDFLDGMSIAGFLLGTAFDRLQLHGESVDHPSRLHRIMDAGSRAFIAVDSDGRIATWTRGAESLFGWTGSEATYRRADDLLKIPPHPATDGTGDATGWIQHAILSRRDGSTFPAEVSRWTVPDAPVQQFLFCRDISALQQRQAGVTRDPLTGLLNRAGMMDTLAEKLAQAAPDDGPGPVLLLVGLQRFKEIDYSSEHHVADEAIRVIGARLAALADRVQPQPPPAVARIAGDEFAILLDRLTDGVDVADLAERAVDTVAQPFEVAGRRLALTAHVGAAEPLTGSDARSLFGDAESALYRSRYSTRIPHNPHANFEIEGLARRRGGSWRHSLPSEMREALREGRFELYYQPVFALPGRVLSGAEALIRWHHPQHGLLLPGTFIDAAEDSGMIGPIGEWVLSAAAAQLRLWDGADLAIAVNLSARQLADPGIVTQVTDAVAALGTSEHAGSLTVEMTESVLMADPEVAATRISQFRAMGVRVSIDDFGTGYSSLAYLKWFDVDVIKIDMSFVRGMETSRTDAAIVRTIIDLARELDLNVVAEGVETPSQLSQLIEWGCTHAQGFGLGRPGPAATLTELLHRAG